MNILRFEGRMVMLP